MKVKRILSLILSLCLVLTGVVSVSLAESSEEPEGALESDNELSVIMEDEAEILLSAASEDEGRTEHLVRCELFGQIHPGQPVRSGSGSSGLQGGHVLR